MEDEQRFRSQGRPKILYNLPCLPTSGVFNLSSTHRGTREVGSAERKSDCTSCLPRMSKRPWATKATNTCQATAARCRQRGLRMNILWQALAHGLHVCGPWMRIFPRSSILLRACGLSEGDQLCSLGKILCELQC